eukprot:1061749-Pelagomonas_calceolata.AAC.1
MQLQWWGRHRRKRACCTNRGEQAVAPSLIASNSDGTAHHVKVSTRKSTRNFLPGPCWTCALAGAAATCQHRQQREEELLGCPGRLPGARCNPYLGQPAPILNL